MIAAPAAPAVSTPLIVDRRTLLTALTMAKAVIHSRSLKPILRCVRLHSTGDQLWIDATDGEIRLTVGVDAVGTLAECAPECEDLIRRVKASRNNSCELAFRTRPSRLVMNGGAVDHVLDTLDSADFPPIPSKPEGVSVALNADDLRRALHVTGQAVALETTRYALNGILLESDNKGLRLVATDGRRLATASITEKTTYEGGVILPARFAKLIEKFSADLELISISIAERKNDKGEPILAGPNWLLSTLAAEGDFPRYRDVVPPDGSRFMVNRQTLIDSLTEVALATDLDNRGVRFSFSPRRLELAALSGSRGAATSKLPCKFTGGGDNAINTGFNPDFVLDAVKTLDGDGVVIELQQNVLSPEGKVAGLAAKFWTDNDQRVCWVVMPINVDLEITRANLGSNYPEAEKVKPGLKRAG